MRTSFLIITLSFFFFGIRAQAPRLVMQTGHTNSVTGFGLTNDGRYTVTVSADNVALIWASESGRMLRAIYPDELINVDVKAKSTVIVNPDGKSFFVYSTVNPIEKAPTPYICGILDGKKIAKLPDEITSAAYSSDGQYLITGDNYFALRIYSAVDGKLVKVISGDSSPPISGTGGVDDDTKNLKSKLLNAAGILKYASNLDGDHNKIIHLKISSDGKYAVTSYADHTVLIWNIGTGKKIKLKKHLDKINDVQFSGDAKSIVTTSDDKTLKKWETTTGELQLNVQFSTPVDKVVFSPASSYDGVGGKYIVTLLFGRFNNEVYPVVLNAKTGEIVKRLEGTYCTDFSFSPDGNVFITYGGSDLKVWDSDSFGLKQHLRSSYRYGSIASSIIFNSTRNFLAAINGNYIALYDIQNYRLITYYDVYLTRNHLEMVRIRDDGKVVLRVSGNQYKILDRENSIFEDYTRTEVDTFDNGQWSPDKKFNYERVETPDGTAIQIVNKATGRRIVKGLKGASMIVFSPDSKLAVAWGGEALNIIDLASEKSTPVIEEGIIIPALIQAQFTPDGKYLLLLVNDDIHAKLSNTSKPEVKKPISLKTMMMEMMQAGQQNNTNLKEVIIDVITGKLKSVLEDSFNFNVNLILSPACASDPAGGRYIVTVGGGAKHKSMTNLWETATGKWIASVSGPTNSASKVFFTSDGQYLISDCGEGVIVQTAVRTGKLVCTFYTSGNSKYSLQVAANGYYRGAKDVVSEFYYVADDYKIMTFDQLDLQYNRPNLVLQYMGSKDTVSINNYKRAYLTRLKRLNMDTLGFNGHLSRPQVAILNTEFITKEAEYKLRIKASDSLSSLRKLNVWVNKVPVFGSAGKAIPGIERKSIDTTILIKLSTGLGADNNIEASVSNAECIESLHSEISLKYSSPIKGNSRVYFVGIGIGRFANRKDTLKWSVKDIRDMAFELKKIHGNNIIIDTLFNQAVNRPNILLIHEKLKSLSEDDKLIIAYSGHGIRSKDGNSFFLSTFSMKFDDPKPECLLPILKN